MNNAFKVGAFSLALMASLVYLLMQDTLAPTGNASNGSGDGKAVTLIMHCAAGIKAPVEKIAKQYTKEYGVKIQLSYGGSGSLLSALEISESGDLYLSADDSYQLIAQKKDLVDEVLHLAFMHPVIAVSKGNPKNITGIQDLSREDIKVSFANPSAASIGKQTKKILTKSAQWKALKSAIEARGVFKPTVNEVANDIKLQAVDAGVVWDTTCNQYEDLELVEVSDFQKHTFTVSVGILRTSKHPTEALRFARYLAARDKGGLLFKEKKFPPIEGDVWATSPEINFFSGGVNRPAIQESIKEFEKREGVRVITTYNGCGILVGQMKGGARPDAYFTCDKSFVASVSDLFDASYSISQMKMIILVPKGNPKDIHSLKDLTKEGLKLGLGNPEQSAFGKLTRSMLRDAGLLEAVMKNCESQVPAGDLLVNQMSANSLDAAIVYIANASNVKENFDMIPIAHPRAQATQTFQVGKNSKYKFLTGRLMKKLLSTQSKGRFQKIGFSWKNGEELKQ